MFKIPFKIEVSHCIEKLEFKGCNKIELEVKDTKFIIKYKNRNYEIKVKKDKNNNTFYFEVDCEKEIICKLCDILESVFSYLIDEKNSNRHYGNHFIKIDRFNIEIIGNYTIRDSFSMISKKHKKLEFDDKEYIVEDFILQTYYEALRASSPKMKYFNLFLILEYIENSKKYKEMFLKEENFFFKEKDFEKCEKCSNFTEQQLKRLKQLCRNKSFTKKSRKEKLYLILKELKVLEINILKSKILKEEDIKKIIENRNKIFHSSQSKDFEKILWFKLFPLCENIVTKSLKDNLWIV